MQPPQQRSPERKRIGLRRIGSGEPERDPPTSLGGQAAEVVDQLICREFCQRQAVSGVGLKK